MELKNLESITMFSLEPKNITEEVVETISNLGIKPVLNDCYCLREGLEEKTLEILLKGSDVLYHRIGGDILVKKDNHTEVISINDFEAFQYLIDIENLNLYQLTKVYGCNEVSEIKDKIQIKGSLKESEELVKEFNSIVKNLYL